MKGSKPITAIGEIEADSVEEFTHEFERPAVLTRLKASTYVGQEYGLRYKFHKIEDGSPTNIIRALDRAYLAGNGENFDLPARVEFEPGQELRVTVENATGRDGTEAYTYTYNARPIVDYDAGAALVETPTETVRDFVSGVFS
jgi:hypothetical protein